MTIKKLLQSATVDSWQAIDDEFRTAENPRHGAAFVLVTVALALVFAHFFGRVGALDAYPKLREFYAALPYPTLHPHVHWGLFKLLNYGIMPWLCIRFVLRRPLSDFGVRWTGTRNAARTYLALLFIALPFVVAASFSPAFLRSYPKYADAGNSLVQFLSWEAIYCVQFLLLEFFFRGFLIFALARYIGSMAVFVMIVPYAMIHFGKPLPECLGSILAGIVLGTISLRTRSIWGGVFLHCFVGVTMDLLALYHTGRIQALFIG